jgi:hypothetical protein
MANVRTGRAMSAWAALGLLGLAACGSGLSAGSTSRPAPSIAATLTPPARSAVPSTTTPAVADFSVVPYQGDQVFGGHDGHFSAVFAAGRPVVLLYYAGL